MRHIWLILLLIMGLGNVVYAESMIFSPNDENLSYYVYDLAVENFLKYPL